MRPVRFLLLGTLLAGTLAVAQAQPPGGFGGRGSRGGFGGGSPDPDAIWNMMAKGKDSVNVNENSFLKRSYEREGRPLPPGGILTKEQFKADFAKRMAERAAGGGGDRGSRGGFGGGPPPAPGSDPGSDWVTNIFKQSDKNQDGYVTMDEASDRLKPNFAQYDANHDGKLDLTEYRNGVTNSMASRAPQPGTPGGPPQWQSQPPGDFNRGRDRDRKAEDEDNARVSVSRYGKLPKEAPSFFTEMDDDRDGMVGLYEWRRHERKTAEFVEMDLNRDGYLTADEWLRYNRIAIEKRDRESDEDGTIPRGPSSGRSASADRGSDRGGSGSDRRSRGSDKSEKGSDDRGKSGRDRSKGDEGDNPFIKRKK